MVLSMGASKRIPLKLHGNPHGAAMGISMVLPWKRSSSMESSVAGPPMGISRKFHGEAHAASMGFLRTRSFSVGDSVRLP